MDLIDDQSEPDCGRAETESPHPVLRVSWMAYRAECERADTSDEPDLPFGWPPSPRPIGVIVGIGGDGMRFVDNFARSPLFAHLHAAPLELPTGAVARGAEVVGPAQDFSLAEAMGRSIAARSVIPAPPLASVAVGTAVSPPELAFARGIASGLRTRGSFVVATVETDTAARRENVLAVFGPETDSMVFGAPADATWLHHYPVRTAAFPPSGVRLICHDLHDAISFWAGRAGFFVRLPADRRAGAPPAPPGGWPTPEAAHLILPMNDNHLMHVEAVANAVAVRLCADGECPSLLLTVSDGRGGPQARVDVVLAASHPRVRQTAAQRLRGSAH